ncbi:hypothetical protein VNI00_016633 [Paramarasmius palmivorus]|uniref:Uncharacterized protein n=1 Tax=Paramarasmius palmivorus TaxID=297713 RepID=A0AAW0BCP8_9AGAR
MRTVSTSSKQEAQAYDRITFSEKQLYKKFFPAEKITHFRTVQSNSRALVTGDPVTLHLSRSPQQSTWLKVLVPKEGLLEIGKFMLTVRYHFVEASYYVGSVLTTLTTTTFEDAVKIDCSSHIVAVEETEEDRAIASTYTFRRTDGTTVEIIRTVNEAIDAVLALRTTLDMNFATHNEIISLYPRSSFVEKNAYYVNDPPDTPDASMIQFSTQGWTFATMVSAVTALDPRNELSFKTRHVGDRHCWIVRFDEYLAAPANFISILFISSWHIYSPTPNSVRLIRNQACCEFPPHSLVVTWEVEKALWAHECVTSVDDIYQAYLNSEVDDNRVDPLDSYPEAQFECGSHSLVSELPPEAFAWKLALEDRLRSRTKHDEVVQNTTRFLTKLYPTLETNFNKSSAFVQMRESFAAARELYTVLGAAIQHPTAYTVSTLIKCIEDVNNTRFSSPANFVLQFDFEWEKDRVWTTCHFHVPSHAIEAVKEDLKFWIEEEFTNGCLKVAILPADDKTGKEYLYAT